ncbi:MAG: molybdenum cofactor biosynthesis protein B [Planctomycetota bacterium]|nr:molybdenum cofactor biosynthesis protein B [Planctomycetota bacterium]MEE2990396.1 molybdenum cofactor biosynthesis protein B [Planctomycetota bacterium]
MASPAEQHHSVSPEVARCAVITVSDTRTLETDSGGARLVELLEEAGHRLITRAIVPDDPAPMHALLEKHRQEDGIDAVLMTGGTGISSRDQTFETVQQLISRPLPGYGELVRMLSYNDIGPAAMLSRATGGLMENTLLLTMPGSPLAIELVMSKIILPELCHLIHEAQR